MQGTSTNLGSVYLGTGEEGINRKKRIEAMFEKRKVAGTIRSLSELVREYVLAGLEADEKKQIKSKRTVSV
jgi:hypothetical protein